MADGRRKCHESEFSLAMSYLQFYQGNDSSTATKSKRPSGEDMQARQGSDVHSVTDQGENISNTTRTNDNNNDLAWESFEWATKDEKKVRQSLKKSLDRCRIDPSLTFKVQQDDDAWNGFYSNHQTNFFKDRHYLDSAFPEEFGPSLKNRVLVEVGCGVGNALLPLLEEDGDKNEKLWSIYGLDLSSVAIDLLKKDERFQSASQEGRAFGFAANIVEGAPLECNKVADIASLLFCLSAIDPELQSRAVRNVAATLKPGGTVVFRDYGRLDESQVKLGSQRSKLLKENFYVKHDATKCYFFTTQDLERLFRDEAGLEVVELFYIRRLYKNRSTDTTRRRVWVQGQFRKPLS